MLSVKKLTKVFPGSRSWVGSRGNDFVAVNSISFTIESGAIVGLLGPNGAGKTTTLNMLIDVLSPTSGSIQYFGKDFHRHKQEIAQHIAFASTYTDLPGNLTPYENMIIYGRLYGLYGSLLIKRINTYIDFFNIRSYAHKQMKMLSAGQKTRVMLAKTFMVHPKFILLDEPTAALDPDVAHDVRSLIMQQQKELGLTVLLSSHNMDEVAAICNRVIVLSAGTIIDDNSPEQLARSVATNCITLQVVSGIEIIAQYCAQQELVCTIEAQTVKIYATEKAIALLLQYCAQHNVIYVAITIEKPTLEDYFLQIARAQTER